MQRLVFIDDDPAELEDFAKIIEDDYDITKIRYPRELERSLTLFAQPKSVFDDPGQMCGIRSLFRLKPVCHHHSELVDRYLAY